MQETSSNSIGVIAPHRGVWYMSLIFFLLSILVSLGLFGLSYLNQQSILKTGDDISRLQTEIDRSSADRNIVVANIITENTIRPSLPLKRIVTDFRLAAIAANVEFEGFSIKDDVISTRLLSQEGNKLHPDPVATIIDMMNSYSVVGSANKKQFKLGDIKTVSGDSTRRITTIELHVLPIITQ